VLLITKKHARMCNFCSRGIREHCERYGLDFKEFIFNGLPEEELSGIDSHYISLMIEAAHKEERGEV
jgi:hypothetical protein